jgi:tetratricopeptide (TPR) repeat protein
MLMEPNGATAAASYAAAVRRLRALLSQQRFSEVLVGAEELLDADPNPRDALLFAAIAQRFLGRVPEALKTLTTLQERNPRFSRLYEERGQCFAAMQQAAPAIDAFLLAVDRNHALPGSWRMLEALYRMTGQHNNAVMAAAQLSALQRLPKDVLLATGLFVDGDLDDAESMVRSYLLQRGHHVEAMRLLANIGIARKIFDDAELLLEAVLVLEPEYRSARREYAEVLIELHKYFPARLELNRLLKDEPDNPLFKTLHATTSVALGDYQQALGMYRDLLLGKSEDADLHLSIGHVLKTMGHTREAIESYRKAAACRTDFGDAYWSLANLKTYRFTEEELTGMRAIESAPTTSQVDRYHVCFALGKALEDGREHAESFRYYERGNSLKQSECKYRPEIIENNTCNQIEVCTREFFDERRGWGASNKDPIFIVGLPRSGSTLMEQILASHSQVEGTHELAIVQQIVQHLRGRDTDRGNPRYPRILTTMPSDEFRRLGEKYITDAQVYRATAPRVPCFVDKMPNNCRHVGLIHLILPNAKIIDVRREPMACCFSNLKQLFARGQEFTYSIDNIARYYRTYLELMTHWERVLPGRVLRIHYEDVVADLEGNVRRLLAFCELDFESRCLDFHKTARSVRTASSEQVRRPINADGLNHWRYFEPWLEPLKTALGDALLRCRDE